MPKGIRAGQAVLNRPGGHQRVGQHLGTPLRGQVRRQPTKGLRAGSAIPIAAGCRQRFGQHLAPLWQVRRQRPKGLRAISGWLELEPMRHLPISEDTCLESGHKQFPRRIGTDTVDRTQHQLAAESLGEAGLVCGVALESASYARRMSREKPR